MDDNDDAQYDDTFALNDDVNLEVDQGEEDEAGEESEAGEEEEQSEASEEDGADEEERTMEFDDTSAVSTPADTSLFWQNPVPGDDNIVRRCLQLQIKDKFSFKEMADAARMFDEVDVSEFCIQRDDDIRKEIEKRESVIIYADSMVSTRAWRRRDIITEAFGTADEPKPQQCTGSQCPRKFRKRKTLTVGSWSRQVQQSSERHMDVLVKLLRPGKAKQSSKRVLVPIPVSFNHTNAARGFTSIFQRQYASKVYQIESIKSSNTISLVNYPPNYHDIQKGMWMFVEDGINSSINQGVQVSKVRKPAENDENGTVIFELSEDLLDGGRQKLREGDRVSFSATLVPQPVMKKLYRRWQLELWRPPYGEEWRSSRAGAGTKIEKKRKLDLENYKERIDKLNKEQLVSLHFMTKSPLDVDGKTERQLKEIFINDCKSRMTNEEVRTEIKRVNQFRDQLNRLARDVANERIQVIDQQYEELRRGDDNDDEIDQLKKQKADIAALVPPPNNRLCSKRNCDITQDEGGERVQKKHKFKKYARLMYKRLGLVEALWRLEMLRSASITGRRWRFGLPVYPTPVEASETVARLLGLDASGDEKSSMCPITTHGVLSDAIMRLRSALSGVTNVDNIKIVCSTDSPLSILDTWGIPGIGVEMLKYITRWIEIEVASRILTIRGEISKEDIERSRDALIYKNEMLQYEREISMDVNVYSSQYMPEGAEKIKGKLHDIWNGIRKDDPRGEPWGLGSWLWTVIIIQVLGRNPFPGEWKDFHMDEAFMRRKINEMKKELDSAQKARLAPMLRKSRGESGEGVDSTLIKTFLDKLEEKNYNGYGDVVTKAVSRTYLSQVQAGSSQNVMNAVFYTIRRYERYEDSLTIDQIIKKHMDDRLVSRNESIYVDVPFSVGSNDIGLGVHSDSLMRCIVGYTPIDVSEYRVDSDIDEVRVADRVLGEDLVASAPDSLSEMLMDKSIAYSREFDAAYVIDPSQTDSYSDLFNTLKDQTETQEKVFVDSCRTGVYLNQFATDYGTLRQLSVMVHYKIVSASVNGIEGDMTSASASTLLKTLSELSPGEITVNIELSSS